nr:MAG TPA: hypothetical protein [Caudoviricetes sp.]
MYENFFAFCCIFSKNKYPLIISKIIFVNKRPQK